MRVHVYGRVRLPNGERQPHVMHDLDLTIDRDQPFEEAVLVALTKIAARSMHEYEVYTIEAVVYERNDRWYAWATKVEIRPNWLLTH